MLLLQAGALILGLAVIGILWLMDHKEDLGRVSDRWMRDQKRGRE